MLDSLKSLQIHLKWKCIILEEFLEISDLTNSRMNFALTGRLE